MLKYIHIARSLIMKNFNDENGKPIESLNADNFENYIKALDRNFGNYDIGDNQFIPFENNDYKKMIEVVSNFTAANRDKYSHLDFAMNAVIAASFERADDKGRDQILDSYIQSQMVHEDYAGRNFGELDNIIKNSRSYDKDNNRPTYQPSKEAQFILAATDNHRYQLPNDFEITKDNIAKYASVVTELAVNNAKIYSTDPNRSNIMVSFANIDKSGNQQGESFEKKQAIAKAIEPNDIFKITNPAYITPDLIDNFVRNHSHPKKLTDMYNFVKNNPKINYDFSKITQYNNDTAFTIKRLIAVDGIKEQLNQGKMIPNNDLANAIIINPSIFDVKKDIPAEQMSPIFHQVKDKINPEVSLQLATEIVKKVNSGEIKSNVADINNLINNVSSNSMKTPNLTDFYVESKKFFDIEKQQLAQKKMEFAEYEGKYQSAKQEESESNRKHQEESRRLSQVENLQKAFKSITPAISTEQAEKAISSIVKGENKNAKIEFTPTSGLKRLFMGSKKKQEEALLQQNIKNFNQKLESLAGSSSDLKAFQGKILASKTQEQLQTDVTQAYEKLKKDGITIKNLTEYGKSNFNSYEGTPKDIGSQLNRQERDLSIFDALEKEQRPIYLKEKAQENLAAKGMDINGKFGGVKADELATTSIKNAEELKKAEYEAGKESRRDALKTKPNGEVSGFVKANNDAQMRIDKLKDTFASRLADPENKDKGTTIEAIKKQGLDKTTLMKEYKARKQATQ